MTVAENTPDIAMRRFRTRNIVTTVMRRSGSDTGTPTPCRQTRGTDGVPSARLRPDLVPGCITFRKGKYFSVRDMDRTQTRLSRLGIFSNIQMQAVPADTSPGCDELDLLYRLPVRPSDGSIDRGRPDLDIQQLFRSGTRFQREQQQCVRRCRKTQCPAQWAAAHEWRTGSGRSNIFNSYEVGLNASLAFPQTARPPGSCAAHTEISTGQRWISGWIS